MPYFFWFNLDFWLKSYLVAASLATSWLLGPKSWNCSEVKHFSAWRLTLLLVPMGPSSHFT